MADNDFDRTGDSLNRIIDDAIRSGNYGSLNSDINREVNRFTDDLVGGIFGTISKTTEAFTGGSRNNGAFEGGNRPSDRTSSWGRASGSYMKPIPPDNVNTYLFRGDASAASGQYVRLILGWPSTVISGISLLATFGVSLTGTLGSAELPALLVIGVWFGVSVYEVVKGNRIGRARRLLKKIKSLYASVQGNTESIDIRYLADSAAGIDKVRADIEWMLDKGWLPQGHLDKDKKILMLTDRAYKLYTDALDGYNARQKEEMKERAEGRHVSEEDKSEAEKAVETGRKYLDEIQHLNDIIPGEPISSKVDTIKLQASRILDRVEQHPEQASQIKELLKYYLPMMIKLLNAYAELDRGADTANARKSKSEIEGALDSLNTAFGKLLDRLYEDTTMDVKSDVDVLNNILSREGLNDGGLKADENTKKGKTVDEFFEKSEDIKLHV